MTFIEKYGPEKGALLKKKALDALQKAKSPEAIEKRRTKMTGRKASQETLLKMRRVHLGKRHSEATKKLLSIKSKARPPFSEEFCKNVSIRQTGKKHSESWCKNISRALRGREGKPWTEARKLGARGRRHTPEAKEKIRQAALLAREERKWNDTYIELAIEKELTLRGIAFTKQKRVAGYNVDFLLSNFKIIIEADGCRFHHCEQCPEKWTDFAPDIVAGKRIYDRTRTTQLSIWGYKVFHFWEHEINKSPASCIDRLCLPANLPQTAFVNVATLPPMEEEE